MLETIGRLGDRVIDTAERAVVEVLWASDVGRNQGFIRSALRRLSADFEYRF